MVFFFCKLFDLFAGTCKRQVKFTSKLDGRALHGHVIRNLTLPLDVRHPCSSQCVMDSRCVSINIGPPINNKVICELSDSDLSLHPADLKVRQGFTFIGTEVRNKNSVSNYNSSCFNYKERLIPGFHHIPKLKLPFFLRFQFYHIKDLIGPWRFTTF